MQQHMVVNAFALNFVTPEEAIAPAQGLVAWLKSLVCAAPAQVVRHVQAGTVISLE